MADVTCLVCGSKVHRGGITCSKCDAPYHVKCWNYAEGKCARYGCGVKEKEVVKKQRIDISRIWCAIIPFLIVIVIAGGIAGLIVGGVLAKNRDRDAYITEYRHFITSAEPLEVRVTKDQRAETYTAKTQILINHGYILLIAGDDFDTWKRKEKEE